MNEDEKRWKQQLKMINKNHPDCVPIFFMRHPQAPNHIKPPTTSFIIFKNDLAIEQAMINLYEQIKTKGLYFFCPYYKKNQVKYSFIKPGPTIKSVYDKFGKNGYLIMVYSDKQLGMQGMITLEKWMIRIVVFIGLLWIFLYGYSYYQSYSQSQIPSKAPESDM